MSCSTTLSYPSYRQPYHCVKQPSNHTTIVWPMRILSTLNEPMLPPVAENGVVFYVYSQERCQKIKTFINQVLFNTRNILSQDTSVVMKSPSYP